MEDFRWPTYGMRNLVLDDAVADSGRHGALRVRDRGGRVFIDAVGGIGCAPLGHGHPRWVEAIATQLKRLSASANIYWTEPQLELSHLLIDLFPIDDGRVFLCNSGTEATEAAIKLVLRATGRDVIVAFEGAFHGRTLGAIALTANPKYREPYVSCLGEPSEPTRFGTIRVARARYDDLGSVRSIFTEYGKRIAAVFVEPVQGESGIHPASREFLVGLRELCNEHGALLGVDEIQSGCGRTGKWAAWSTIVGDDPRLRPDLLWLAKALGGGFPVGACIARRELAASMSRGSHGTTFGGNPVACTAALETLRIMQDEDLLARACHQIDILREIAAARPLDRVVEVRGLGAMIGIDIAGEGEPATPLADAMAEEGVLVTICVGKTVRLLLPYHAGEPELREIWEALGRALSRVG